MDKLPTEIILRINEYSHYFTDKHGFYYCCKWVKTVFDSNNLWDNIYFLDRVDWYYVAKFKSKNQKHLECYSQNYLDSFTLFSQFLIIDELCINIMYTDYDEEEHENIMYYFDKNPLNISTLKKLIVCGGEFESDDCFNYLPKLEELSLLEGGVEIYAGITDNSLLNLTNLTKFHDQSYDASYTNLSISKMINLTYLYTYSCDSLNDDGIKPLVNLVKISIRGDNITDYGIENLVKLKYLHMEYNTKITNYGLCRLPLLETINLHDNKLLTAGVLFYELHNLKSFNGVEYSE